MPLSLRYHVRLRCLCYSSELMPLVMTGKEYKGWCLLPQLAMMLYRFDITDLMNWGSVPMIFNTPARGWQNGRWNNWTSMKGGAVGCRFFWKEVFSKQVFSWQGLLEIFWAGNLMKNEKVFWTVKMEVHMRCLIYTRVSTTTHDQTTENQVAQLRPHISQGDWSPQTNHHQ